MYIQPSNNSVNMYGSKKDPGFIKRLKQKALDAFPEVTVKDDAQRIKHWKNIDEKISRPAENRLIMGATALVTQPVIDYSNHKVDQETREISRIRTIAKIIAGTMVGIVVRGSCYKLVKATTNVAGHSKWSKALLPTKFREDLIKDSTLLKNYCNALSTSLAIMAMCITNFVIDAPLTVFLTNRFNEHRLERMAKNSSKEADGRIEHV